MAYTIVKSESRPAHDPGTLNARREARLMDVNQPNGLSVDRSRS